MYKYFTFEDLETNKKLFSDRLSNIQTDTSKTLKLIESSNKLNQSIVIF